MTVEEFKELPDNQQEELVKFYNSFFNVIEKERLENELIEEESELDKLIRKANEKYNSKNC
jgi:hypothetical protein